jgi:hypothetical protein
MFCAALLIAGTSIVTAIRTGEGKSNVTVTLTVNTNRTDIFVDPTPGKDNVSPEVQSPTAKSQVASVPHTTNHGPTVPTNIHEYNVDS